MSTQEQRSSATPAHHDNEQANETVVEKKQDIPASWDLSPEQRAFIDLFIEDDKQER
ncbi:hypothetical protein RYZ59_18350 [Citrobacter sp. HN-141]|uniref:hypothetical protein n=1 Tax=unclassified Citrobacter TaxID=2644389 RepID=UPI0029655635|nr:MULTISPECIES: hypothetical protein [unclassified Citrobacter]MDW2645523.1 hypothetical protein [Citrobacter sp. HN-141]MDW2655073.1 hypothetical protein [Citrobacter sp. HN-120]MDW2698098.1 hypothetical protein [Citrobacter sp. HN-144]